MEPRIQYAKTTDGVSIAYLTLGEGTLLLLQRGWSNSLEYWRVLVMWKG